MTMRPWPSLASPSSLMSTSTDEALTDLAHRLEQRGIRARVWEHDGMTVAMTHREGDTTATIDEALVDGTNLIEDLAAEIAAEQGLPPDWLGRVAAEGPPTHPGRLATAYEYSLSIAVRHATRLADASLRTARHPSAGWLRKHLALAGIKTAGLAVKLVRRMPSAAASARSASSAPGSLVAYRKPQSAVGRTAGAS